MSGGRRSRWVWPVAGVAAVAVTALGAVVWLGRDVEHTTAGPLGEELAVPASVSEVGWTWRPPEDARVYRVYRGTAGMVVALDDGVVAVHGRTGEELWRYRRTDGVVASGVTPDGSSVVVAFRVGGSSGSEGRLLVLDAATGEVRHRHEFSLSGGERGSTAEELAALPEVRMLTSSVRVVPDGTDLVGYALESNEEVWRFAAPPECGHGPATSAGDGWGTLFHSEVVVVPLVCVPGVDDIDEVEPNTDPDTASLVVALDAETGREVWRHENTGDAGDTSPDLRASVDGTALTIAERFTDDMEYALSGDRRVLDIETGEVLVESVEEVAGKRDVFQVDGAAGTLTYSLTSGQGEDAAVEYGQLSFDGDVLATAVLPEDAVGRGRGFYGPIRNNFDHRTTAAVLEDGITVLTCDRECRTADDPEAVRIQGMMLPWDGSSPEGGIPLGDHLDPWNPSRTDVQVPVPGAVVVYQTDYGLEMLLTGVGERSPHTFPDTSEAIVGLV
ncbi:PQQ-binding-like beta-propeller repeat protein [Thermobifida halotolerans]|uniref:PQQ-binding-like beta-propeller repeat protein n=1 Tax=Thermobifida halotolerans TaxID=483545 RepID=A0AA97LVZ3_9ACTN|nr:PQQ-binding-like beta-propeller repeat protein [Thermobifida halotolerans]UOE19048.1 PQQ-binding-like beta-propeller repeat protein [Thermobifida halotolerans]